MLKRILVLIVINGVLSFNAEEKPVTEDDLDLAFSDAEFRYYRPVSRASVEDDRPSRGYLDPGPQFLPHQNGVPGPPNGYNPEFNPLLTALQVSSALDIRQKSIGYNNPQHLPVNPYIALLLSHYGKYIPVYGTGRGLYSYAAANNYHNNQPIGSYKIYEDSDN